MEQELARQSAHVYLDALTAYDNLDDPEPDTAINLALQRLDEIGAVIVTYDDQTDLRTVNISPVVHSALRLMTSLITSRLMDRDDLSGLQVIAELRAIVDAVADTPDP